MVFFIVSKKVAAMDTLGPKVPQIMGVSSAVALERLKAQCSILCIPQLVLNPVLRMLSSYYETTL